MKRASLIIIPLIAVLLGWYIIVPELTLQLAKRSAAREYANSRPLLNSVPQSSPNRLVPADDYTNAVWMDVGGFSLGFPADRYTRDSDPKRGKIMLHHARYRLMVFPADAPKEWDEVMRPLDETNFYSFVLRAFNATEQDIQRQPTIGKLEKHLILLKVKTMLSCVGFEDSCIQFDRGDFKGFIIGDPARNKNLYVHVFVDHGRRLINLGILQKAPSQLSDIEALLAIVKVRST